MSADLPKRSAPVSATVFTVGFGVLLMAMGALFVRLLWDDYQAAARQHRFTEVPCEILLSQVDEQMPVPDAPLSYHPLVKYRYTYQGQSYESEQIKSSPSRTNHEAKAQAVVAQYPLGLGAVCYVDPDHPTYSLLKRKTKASLYTIWFPALFVVGGLGMVLSALRSRFFSARKNA
jgi:hypothetical protein